LKTRQDERQLKSCRDYTCTPPASHVNMPRSQGTSRKGKPKSADRASGMGRALTKAQTKRFVVKDNGAGRHGAGMMASGARDIGMEGGADTDMKMKSVLEIDNLSDFILQAEMANKEFNVEKEQLIVLDKASSMYDPNSKRVTFEGEGPSGGGAEFKFSELSVPRRPAWTTSMTAAELDFLENESFLNWRRAIAVQEEVLNRHQMLEASEGAHPQQQVTVTPFEKNIQVWKQLWRVLEQSACLIQIVDARNPLFYYSSDLKKYCMEELGKPMIVLVNKSDFLTPKQRNMWHKYFTNDKVHHIFFSARMEQEKLDAQILEDAGLVDDASDTEDPIIVPSEGTAQAYNISEYGQDRLFTRQQLHDNLRIFSKTHNCKPTGTRYLNRVQFGMVGFPNVGKSSVINVLVGSSKHVHNGVTRVGVASQPGKTKHFQTVLINDRDDIMLCDCPGLVFPSFVSSTADMIAAGVYPIDQMRDIYLVMNLLTQRIRVRDIWNAKYGITLPVPGSLALHEMGWGEQHGNEEDGLAKLYRLPAPTSREVLDTYCKSRSLYAASSGILDHQMAARTLIKDYVSGKLLYCHPPPTTTTLSSGDDDNGGDISIFSSQDEAKFVKETLLKALEEELYKSDEHGSLTNARARVLQALEANAKLLTSRAGDGDSNDVNAAATSDNNNIDNSAADIAFLQDDLLLLDTVAGLDSLKLTHSKTKANHESNTKGASSKGKSAKRDRIKARKTQGRGSTMFVSSVPV
jgi:large subunit GTPase 1